MVNVMIHPADYMNVRQAVDRAFELFSLDVKGKKVLIKPNVLRASGSEEGIVTHPAVLGAVVDRVEEMAPASLVVGDNPGLFNYGANEESFQQTGLMAAAKGYYQNIGNASETLKFNPDFMPKVNVSEAVLDADIIISLPKFKTHGLTVITGAVKNSYGILPGAQKALLHKAAGSPERFHEVIVEVFGIRVPDLFIMDAVVGMEGNGPASTDLRDIGLVLASDNAVALDAVVARMMGLEPGRLRFLEKAQEMGFGSYDSDQIRIEGAFKVIPEFKVPPLGGEAIMGNPEIQNIIDQKTSLTPQADPELCTACGTCVDHCPASALTMVDDLPRVDIELCVTCFCCQEMCPEKAITLK
ncbi:MAG: DUF362 domain-containing protein [Deltaproteobacteria bacterium]|jgi:uncharacterized protein (DUF362 family)/Pyruvate/2-oxoacid:ferredoxin oxidoreductase delta subunit